MNDSLAPVCWIIAGPNGAGKTTFALHHLPQVAGCRNFVNADLIAAGLSPLAPETQKVAAGRIFLQEIQRHEQSRENFGFETTLAGRGYLRLIRRLQHAGWRIELIFLALSSPEMARFRVAERVAHGGHDIPETDIERRFYRGLSNLFQHYLLAANRTLCFLNDEETPNLVFTQEGNNRKIIRPEIFQTFLEMATS